MLFDFLHITHITGGQTWFVSVNKGWKNWSYVSKTLYCMLQWICIHYSILKLWLANTLASHVYNSVCEQLVCLIFLIKVFQRISTIMCSFLNKKAFLWLSRHLWTVKLIVYLYRHVLILISDTVHTIMVDLHKIKTALILRWTSLFPQCVKYF